MRLSNNLEFSKRTAQEVVILSKKKFYLSKQLLKRKWKIRKFLLKRNKKIMMMLEDAVSGISCLENAVLKTIRKENMKEPKENSKLSSIFSKELVITWATLIILFYFQTH